MSIGLDDLTVEAAKTPVELATDRFYFVRHGQTAGNASGIVPVSYTHLTLPTICSV